MEKKSRIGAPGLPELAALALMVGVFLAVQFTRLNTAPWDMFESWRQSDTYCMALNYYHFGMDLLRPQLNYDGVANNFAQLELQIIPFLSALLFHILHTTTWVIPRVISLLFFLGSALYLYLLMREFTDGFAAVAGVGCYLFLPLSMLTAASIQPESCALFFFCGAAYYLKRFQSSALPRHAVGAAVMTAFGIMEKTPVAFIGLLFFYVLWSVLGKGCFKSPLFYGCGAIALLPPALLIFYTSTQSVFRFVDGIAGKHIFSEQIFSLFTRAGLSFFYTSARDYFGWALLVPAVIGFFLCFEKRYRFYLVWTSAFLLECVTIVAVIRFTYYLVFMLPVCAVLVSLTVQQLRKCRRWVAPVACAAALLLTLGLDTARWASTRVDADVDQVGAFLAENTGQDEALAIAVVNPAYLNAADRRGFRANLSLYDYIPSGPEGEIDYYIRQGVDKFAVVGQTVCNDSDGSYLAYLDAHFPVSARSDRCTIYDLTGTVEVTG